MNSQEEHIRKCKALIEQKLAWGSSDYWQNRDFEQLSERISEVTNVSLSTSTLKRIWGKVNYTGSPTATTLNALAQFAGYPDWQTFAGQPTVVMPAPIPASAVEQPPRNFLSRVRLNWLLVTATAVILLTGILAYNQRASRLIYGKLLFTSKPVTRGLPNTVVFQYNAADSNADSVFIQQNWDPKRRYKVDKNRQYYTSTYYTPGYFRAKLILNDSIVKEHDLFIESDGWLGMIDLTPVPTYFSRDRIQQHGLIGVTEQDLLAEKIDLQQQVPWVSFYQVARQLAVPGSHFLMEAELRNTFAKGQGVCRQTKIILLGSRGALSIPLSIKGCVGELSMFMGEQYIDGKTTDLSAFGVDFRDFVNVRCKTENQKITIQLNDRIAYQGEFSQDIGTIVGARIRFMGTGEIRKFSLKAL